MKRKSIFKKQYFLLFLSLFFLSLNFFPFHFLRLPTKKMAWELYEPTLAARIRSVDELLRYTDSLAVVQNVSPKTLDYGILLNRVIKKRFYHGYSHYALNENWIATFCGKFIWYDLSAIVLPDDILKYPMAACSQQSIVLMECLRRRGISYRKVGFDHHYVIEANFGGWYYFDPDLEPNFSNVPRGSLDFLVHKNLLFKIYRNSMDSAQVKYALANPRYGKVNAQAAPNAMLFHKATRIISKALWLLPLAALLFFYQRRGKESAKKMSENGPLKELLGEEFQIPA